MSQYQKLSQRYYKFFKYSRLVAFISFGLFLVVTAINTGNETLNMISYFLMLLTFATVIEASVLYVLYIALRNR